MPGLSAAPSVTVDLMRASCASLVGCCSAREMPRIILVLAPHAHRGGASVDRVGRNESCAAAMAREACTAIRVELVDERPALPTRVAIVAKTGSARFDRLAKNANDRVAQQLRFLERH